MTTPKSCVAKFTTHPDDNGCIRNCRWDDCRCLDCDQTLKKRLEGKCIEEYCDCFDQTVYYYMCNRDQHHCICYCDGFRLHYTGELKKCISPAITAFEYHHDAFLYNFCLKLRSSSKFFKNRDVMNKLYYLFYKTIVLCIYYREKEYVGKFFSYKYFKRIVKRIINEKNGGCFLENYKNIAMLINKNSNMFDLKELNVKRSDQINFEYLLNKIRNEITAIACASRMKKLYNLAYGSKSGSNCRFDCDLYDMIKYIYGGDIQKNFNIFE